MDYMLAGSAAFLGMLGTLIVIDAVRCVRRRWQCHRTEVKGQIHLFEEDGDHFLSAKLPVEGLQRLLEEFNRGRLR
jgi:hypothetical protein